MLRVFSSVPVALPHPVFAAFGNNLNGPIPSEVAFLPNLKRFGT